MLTPCGEGLAVGVTVDGRELGRMLQLLREERCAHSWRNFAPTADPDLLWEWENALRPTTLFFYYQTGADGAVQEPRLVAAATVADAINRKFPYAGFPVLARCYILPEYRGQGLYTRILQHRLEFCHKRFGAGLRGIHLGTADERLAARISRADGARPLFVRLGSQSVAVGSQVCTVGAYLHLTASYLEGICSSLDGPDAPAAVHALRERIALLLSGAPGEHAAALRDAFFAARAAGWPSPDRSQSIEQLLDLCAAIPLLGF